MKDTAVSLIIPIYNADAYLQACLDSVTEQTLFPRMQVLLIDDGSTDASPEICDVYAQKYANIYVSHRRNAGVSAARNAALDLAVGEYIAFADADDLLLPDMMERLYTAAVRTGAQLCCCAFCSQTADGEEIKRYPFPENEPFGRDEAVRYMLTNESFNALWNKLFLRERVVAGQLRMTVGRKLGEDREFILRFLTLCDTLCYVPQVGYFYRYVATGAVRRPQRGYAKALTAQFASDREQFAQLGIGEQDFLAGSAQFFTQRIAAAIDVLCRGYSGTARLRALRRFYADKPLQEILRTLLPLAKPDMKVYSFVLLKCMQLRLAAATPIWLWALDVRTRLYRALHKGGRA